MKQSENGVIICVLPEVLERLHEEDDANAKLIAASPELLEALKRLLPMAEKFVQNAHKEAKSKTDKEVVELWERIDLAQARSAIAKATK